MTRAYLVTVALFALAFSFSYADDPSPLQDICVELNNSSDSVVFINGKVCKDPKLATADDFYFAGLNIAGNTENIFGSNFTPVTIPGLNTLGLTVGRIDFAPNGQSPPHIHPHASETIVVLEGTLYVGFVTSNPDNRLFTKVLNKGDVFAIPIGLIHFQFNVGKTNAVVIATLSSQNPGTVLIANNIFGSNPPINPDVLTNAFQLEKSVVEHLQKIF